MGNSNEIDRVGEILSKFYDDLSGAYQCISFSNSGIGVDAKRVREQAETETKRNIDKAKSDLGRVLAEWGEKNADDFNHGFIPSQNFKIMLADLFGWEGE